MCKNIVLVGHYKSVPIFEQRCVKMKCVQLAGTEQQMPIVGLGTWQAKPEEIEQIVLQALLLGYRHIDTAFNYNNEQAIGNALQRWFTLENGKREDLFITTKLPHIGNRPQDVQRFLKMSLERLQLDYIDLYLVHMPFGFVCDEATLTPAVNSDGEFQIDSLTDHIRTWQVLEEQVNAGFIKNIGLSNFNENQLLNVYNNAKIKPSVLQVEMHAYLQQRELRELCKKLNVKVTAYSPLGSPGAKDHFKTKYNFALDTFPNILGHPIVLELATKYNKTPAQVLLRHLTQQDVVVIPKSANSQRMNDNISIFDFEIDEADMDKLNSLDQKEDGRIFNFLFFKGVEKHPEYPFKLQNSRQ